MPSTYGTIAFGESLNLPRQKSSSITAEAGGNLPGGSDVNPMLTEKALLRERRKRKRVKRGVGRLYK
jgi:hypothetical protein